MSTKCYAMVRGSAIRATALDDRGRYGSPLMFATSKAIATVRVNETVESAKIETERNPEEEGRTRFIRPAQSIRSVVDINFLRVDPGILSLIGGVQVIHKGVTGGGFGEMEFGYGPFGEYLEPTDIVGFEVDTRLPATSFALEVWSKLDSESARPALLGFDELPFDDYPFDVGVDGAGCNTGRQWGYTLFQHLRGGRISGFEFANGVVSFNITGAMSRRTREWGVGPYDLSGDFERMISAVSRNTAFRQMVTPASPPVETCGLQTRYDVIDNGTAADPLPIPDAPLVLDGGGADTSPYIINGGRA